MKPVCPICNAYLLKIIELPQFRKCVSCGFTRKDYKMGDIDWTNPKCKITEHFSVNEAIYLPTWDRMATEADGLTQEIQDNLVNLCFIMEKVRDLLGVPMVVHCTYRPPEYSKEVGGSLTDPHTRGQAIDFNLDGMEIEDAKNALLPKLEELGLRMEQGTSSWIHLDTCPVIHNRYFKP